MLFNCMFQTSFSACFLSCAVNGESQLIIFLDEMWTESCPLVIIVSKGFESQYAVKTPSEQIHNTRLAEQAFYFTDLSQQDFLAIC